MPAPAILNRCTRRSRAIAVAATCLLSAPSQARADEAAILSGLSEYFRQTDPVARAESVTAIQGDPAFDRGRLGGWLHRARPVPSIEWDENRRAVIEVSLPEGASRWVTIRAPAGYAPTAGTPWPLIYALHGTGGDPDSILRYLERVLGERIEKFLVAAPADYQQVVVHNEGPVSQEHPAILRALRRNFDIDSDRVYCAGYSRGGHASWTLAVLHADQLAGILPLAGTFSLQGVDELWDAFLPNLKSSCIVHVWGAGDTQGDDGIASPQGGIAGVSRLLRTHTERLALPVTHLELSDRGHGDVSPPDDAIERWLACKRLHYPLQVQQTCRWCYQASAYWIEGHVWKGPHWDESPLQVQTGPGEPAADALHRAIRARLGRLTGSVEGQVIDVRRDKIQELTVWIGDGMVDLALPITLRVSGKEVWKGRLEPDLGVCMAQALRTYDFERLRWAGLRFRAGHKVEPVTAATVFSDPSD